MTKMLSTEQTRTELGINFIKTISKKLFKKANKDQKI